MGRRKVKFVSGFSSSWVSQINKLVEESPVAFSSEKKVAMVVFVGSRIVGVLFTTAEYQTFSFSVVVAPDYQQKGIGKALIEEGLRIFGLEKAEKGVDLELKVVNLSLCPHLRKLGLVELFSDGDNVYMGESDCLRSHPYVIGSWCLV